MVTGNPHSAILNHQGKWSLVLSVSLIAETVLVHSMMTFDSKGHARANKLISHAHLLSHPPNALVASAPIIQAPTSWRGFKRPRANFVFLQVFA